MINEVTEYQFYCLVIDTAETSIESAYDLMFNDAETTAYMEANDLTACEMLEVITETAQDYYNLTNRG